MPKEIVPQLAFDRLFRNARTPVSSVDSQHPSLVASLQRDETSVLDLVLEQAKSLRRKGSSGDQARLDQYFDSVRSVEQRMEAAMRPQKRWINQGKFPLERPAPGLPDSHAEHVRLMLDILLLALWSDNTRIATMMLGDAQSSQDYSFLPGVKGSFHGLSHHRNIEATRVQYEKIVTWNIEQTAYFLKRMKSLDEGGTSLLDNSMVLFGGSLKTATVTMENLPLILAGRGKGALKRTPPPRAGEDAALQPAPGDAASHGRDGEIFGDSTGPLEGLS